MKTARLAVGRRHIVSDRASSAAARRARRISAAGAGGAGRQIARRLCRSDGIDEERFAALLGRDPVPEPAVGQPRRPDTRSQHQRRRVVGHELFGARVVGRRQRPRRSCLLRQGGPARCGGRRSKRESAREKPLFRSRHHHSFPSAIIVNRTWDFMDTPAPTAADIQPEFFSAQITRARRFCLELNSAIRESNQVKS